MLRALISGWAGGLCFLKFLKLPRASPGGSPLPPLLPTPGRSSTLPAQFGLNVSFPPSVPLGEQSQGSGASPADSAVSQREGKISLPEGCLSHLPPLPMLTGCGQGIAVSCPVSLTWASTSYLGFSLLWAPPASLTFSTGLPELKLWSPTYWEPLRGPAGHATLLGPLERHPWESPKPRAGCWEGFCGNPQSPQPWRMAFPAPLQPFLPSC